MENDKNPDIEQEQIETPETETSYEEEESETDYKTLYEQTLAQQEERRNAARERRQQFIKTVEKPITNPNREQDGEVARRIKNLERIEEKRQFGFENGLSPEETDKVFAISRGKPTKELLDDPFVKAGIEGLREKKRLEVNIPSSSSRATILNQKEFSELPKEGKQAAFEELMNSRKK